MKTENLFAVTMTAAILLAVFAARAQSGKTLYDGNDRRGWDVSALDAARHVDYLSELEKDVILELNMVRSNPGKYAEMYILPRMRYFQGNRYEEPGKVTIITNEGARAVKECYDELKRLTPRQPLQPSRGLSLAARDHVADIGPVGKTDHTGADGSSMTQRIERHGTWKGGISENISFGGDNTGRWVVVKLLIDDGVASRGHRINIMNENSRYVGVSTGYHAKYKSMCVQNFANGIIEKIPEKNAATPVNPQPTASASINPLPADDAILVNLKDGKVEFELGGIDVRVGTLVVYDSDGKSVKRLPARGTTVKWDLTDTRGRQVPAGVYVIEGEVMTFNNRRHKASLKVDVR